ncbi:MAG TPA: YceI family protein [Patescibacteria group bacterium]|nr:YceI family protein [Patescibacteria group bacterium]
MKPATVFTILGLLSSLNSDAVYLSSGAPLPRFTSVKGKIRIEGSSNIDNWQVESKSLQGELQAADLWSGAQRTEPAPIEACAELFIPTRTLKSIERDGRPFSNKMDAIMHEALRANEDPTIAFKLKRLTVKNPPNIAGAAGELEAQGQVTVAGVSIETTFPVKVLSLSRDQLRLSGSTTMKMSDFRIEPPAPKIALGLVKTADEIKVSFDWVVQRQK